MCLQIKRGSNEKEAIELIHKQITDNIENELVNAYLIDDENMSQANVEALYDSKTQKIKNTISNTLSDFRLGLLVNSRGLSSEQVNLLSINSMIANEQVQDETLIGNLDELISVSLAGTLDPSVIPTKGFFKSIGKFFSKVIKTAIVIVSVVIIGVTAVVSSPVANIMIGLPLVIQIIRSAKSTYNWVGWNDWSKW